MTQLTVKLALPGVVTSSAFFFEPQPSIVSSKPLLSDITVLVFSVDEDQASIQQLEIKGLTTFIL